MSLVVSACEQLCLRNCRYGPPPPPGTPGDHRRWAFVPEGTVSRQGGVRATVFQGETLPPRTQTRTSPRMQDQDTGPRTQTENHQSGAKDVREIAALQVLSD